MRFLLPPSILACLLVFVSFIPAKQVSPSIVTVSPLAGYSTEWNDGRYLKCNTAANAKYMTAAEKEVIYILNLARINPALFANTVIKKYPTQHSDYYSSLFKTMLTLKPLKLIYPDSLCFAGAQCHAINSGQEGYAGHTRSQQECRKKWYYNGECCDYGHNEPVDIIMSLLIDEDIPSLGHRSICLDDYKGMGVSIQFHKTYRYNTVLDFHY